ncbi:MAG: GAF domain-containing protein [Chloroflexi bacterium]|nr:MAG: GAF domain-containing protein [Chloroflexota bacterium]
MSTKPNIGRTELLDESSLKEVLHAGAKMAYQPFPNKDIAAGDGGHPVWRVRFEVPASKEKRLGIDINDETIFGRGNDLPNLMDLTPLGAETLGVSRHHMMLRPTPTNLFLIDLNSTNGTMRNGRSIGIRTPYSLVDGDVLTLGKLQVVVRIIERPTLQTTPLQKEAMTLADALSQIAKAITSQLDLDDVLNQVAAIAMSLTGATEAGIWLMDETTGELFLEAERGMEDVRVRRKQFPLRDDSLVARVIRTGKPVRARNKSGDDRLQVTTGYLVEALVYVPITLGGVTFGVLTAVHRQPGHRFRDREQQLLTAVADFAAIAIQNARLFQATDKALERRLRELSALNEVSRAVSSSLDLDQVYQVLVDEVNKYCPVEAVGLCLYDKRRNELHPLGQIEGATNFCPRSADRGIIGTAVQTGQTLVTNDASEHAAYDATVDVLEDKEIRSIAVIPLSIQDQVVGVLALLNRNGGDFTEQDVDLLEAFANPVATAIENARLFEESERQRVAIQATAQTLSQPLMVLDEQGNLLVANVAAEALLTSHMSQMFDAISNGVGRTTEVNIGEQTFLSTTEHLADVGTIIVMQDISYVKELEQDRSEFMHMLSHDLKNPLMAITGWSSMLERTVLLDAQGGQFVNEINIASDRMLRMINQLLETVDQKDAVQLERNPCQLEAIVEQIVTDVQGAALNKSIIINYVNSGAITPVLGDKTRLYHMVLNLVDNAIKYSSSNTLVEVILDFGEDDILIQVLDEGPGIPEEDLERIFDKYFRSVHKDTESGSGLGLSAVRAIAIAHGGTVKAENRKKGGTRFTVTLPASMRLTNGQSE